MDERRATLDANRLWEKIGEHDGRIKSVEAGQYQAGQAIINHRGETMTMIREIRIDSEKYHNSIAERFDSIGKKLDVFQKFQWVLIGGGVVVGAMVTTMSIIAWNILSNYEKIKWLWTSNPVR